MPAVSSIELKRPIWQNIVVLTLGFWLSSSLIVDWVIMPSLYISGMMTQAGFATAGYLIFWNFNRIELLAAALVLTGVLVLDKMQIANPKWHRNAIILSLLLLAVSVIETYTLTPQMSAIGLQLNLFDATKEIPTTMNQMHAAYWVLEGLKWVLGGALLSFCLKQEA